MEKIAFRKFESGKIIGVFIDIRNDNDEYLCVDEAGNKYLYTGLYINRNTEKCNYRSLEYLEVYATIEDMGYEIEYSDFYRLNTVVKRIRSTMKYVYQIWLCDNSVLFENPHQRYYLKFVDKVNAVPVSKDNAEKLVRQFRKIDDLKNYDVPELHNDYENIVEVLDSYNEVKLIGQLKF